MDRPRDSNPGSSDPSSSALDPSAFSHPRDAAIRRRDLGCAHDETAESRSLATSLLVAQFAVLGWSVMRIQVDAGKGLDLDGVLAVAVTVGVVLWIATTLVRRSA